MSQYSLILCFFPGYLAPIVMKIPLVTWQADEGICNGKRGKASTEIFKLLSTKSKYSYKNKA